jgi:hypothetical protein
VLASDLYHVRTVTAPYGFGAAMGARAGIAEAPLGLTTTYHMTTPVSGNLFATSGFVR